MKLGNLILAVGLAAGDGKASTSQLERVNENLEVLAAKIKDIFIREKAEAENRKEKLQALLKQKDDREKDAEAAVVVCPDGYQLINGVCTGVSGVVYTEPYYGGNAYYGGGYYGGRQAGRSAGRRAARRTGRRNLKEENKEVNEKEQLLGDIANVVSDVTGTSRRPYDRYDRGYDRYDRYGRGYDRYDGYDRKPYGRRYLEEEEKEVTKEEEKILDGKIKQMFNSGSEFGTSIRERRYRIIRPNNSNEN
eukprot:GHVP01000084.1.p1 GENE.GHVP01000084.1~~GHVP01000084.1.p1  ORF type:complete len:249 (-),score=47.63 GHVP01000084.1:16-762(-)